MVIRMKKGQVLEGVVTRIDFPNKGIVETEEGICMVKNALPGQRVRCSVNKVRKGKAEGRLLEVVLRAPQETDSPCPHFGNCGSCIYLSLPYEEQLQIKEEQVKRLLDSALSGQKEYCFEGIRPSPVCFGYRNKMEFSFGDEIKDGPLSLGMHKRGSFYDIVSVTDCQIVDEDYRRILKGVRVYFAAKQEQGIPVTFYHRLRHTGYLRHLLVRKAVKTGEILLALVTTTQTPESGRRSEELLFDEEKRSEAALSEAELLDGMKNDLLALPLQGKIAGILHIRNDSVADVVQSDETTVLYGKEYFYEELLGLKFRISPFSFFQTNSLGAEVLYQTAREYIADCAADKVVFDLYSGTGTIAQLMASVAKRVIGVEIVEEAVEAALENAKLNGLHNCEFLAGDVLKVLDTIEEKPDMIILDPPRDGIHPKALQKIIRYGVENILYISCKPTSLVRDLEAFLAGGYVAERAVAVDMFPFTGGIESIVLLSKLHTKQNIEVELEMSEMDLTAAESKATYEEIKDYVLEHTGLKVSSLYIAQIKEKCGIIERVNYNQPKSENSRQPKCPLEKETAIRRALEHFHMI